MRLAGWIRRSRRFRLNCNGQTDGQTLISRCKDAPNNQKLEADFDVASQVLFSQVAKIRPESLIQPFFSLPRVLCACTLDAPDTRTCTETLIHSAKGRKPNVLTAGWVSRGMREGNLIKRNQKNIFDPCHRRASFLQPMADAFAYVTISWFVCPSDSFLLDRFQ